MNISRKSKQPTEPRRTAAISTGQFVSGSLFRLVREIRGSAYSVGDMFMLLDEADCHDPNILKLGGTGETFFTDPAGRPLKIEAGDNQIDSIFEFVQDPQQIVEESCKEPPSNNPVTESELKKLTEQLQQSIQEIRERPPVPGPKGDRGEPGGVKGPKGDRGIPGLRGKQGKMGERGPRGLKGERGPRGSVGTPGKRGPEGKVGPKGPKGDKGDRGEKGNTGDSGLLAVKFPLVYDSKTKTVGIDEARLDSILKRILSGKSLSPADMGWLASTGGGGKVAVLVNGIKVTPDVRSLDFTGAGVTLSHSKTGGKVTVNISGSTAASGGVVGGTNFFYQETPPVSGVTIGSRWMDSESGQEYVYIDDGNTEQWVQPSASNMIRATVNTVVGVTGAKYTATQLDYYIGVSFSGQCSITLPENPETGREVIVKDESGNAGKGSNRKITIIPSDNSTIDSKESAIINIDNAALHFIYRNGWRIV